MSDLFCRQYESLKAAPHARSQQVPKWCAVPTELAAQTVQLRSLAELERGFADLTLQTRCRVRVNHVALGSFIDLLHGQGSRLYSGLLVVGLKDFLHGRPHSGADDLVLKTSLLCLEKTLGGLF